MSKRETTGAEPVVSSFMGDIGGCALLSSGGILVQELHPKMLKVDR